MCCVYVYVYLLVTMELRAVALLLVLKAQHIPLVRETTVMAFPELQEEGGPDHHEDRIDYHTQTQTR